MASPTNLEQLANSSTERAAIRPASERSAIQELQHTLYALGFGQALQWAKYGADGHYGPATTTAVQDFCARNGLKSTGETVTPIIACQLVQRYQALDALQQLDADLKARKIETAYYQGAVDTVAVGALQTLLNELGLGEALQWEKYGADGHYGPATARALRQFAQQQGLPSDGKQLTQEIALRILDTLAPCYGPQWATTNVLACQTPTNKLLTVFTATHFIGKKVIANQHFLPALRRINQYAQESQVKVYVTSSFRPAGYVNGAIVAPATFSNHLIGHAIDMNLVDGPEATFLNAQALSQKTLPPATAAFIQAIREDPELRWGGDFQVRDVVHIDDNAYHRDKARWLAAYSTIQNQLNEAHLA